MALTQWNGSERNTICEYSFQLTETAEADLDDILGYMTNELANLIAAASFFHQLQDKIKETCQFPQSGSEIDNEYLPWPAIRFQMVGSYLFYYEADHKNKTIIILRIVYGPRNQEEIQMELKK